MFDIRIGCQKSDTMLKGSQYLYSQYTHKIGVQINKKVLTMSVSYLESLSIDSVWYLFNDNHS